MVMCCKHKCSETATHKGFVGRLIVYSCPKHLNQVECPEALTSLGELFPPADSLTRIKVRDYQYKDGLNIVINENVTKFEIGQPFMIVSTKRDKICPISSTYHCRVLFTHYCYSTQIPDVYVPSHPFQAEPERRVTVIGHV